MSKVMTMREAISKFVKSGSTLFISGAQHGEPSAAVHEIVRQRIEHLTLICALASTTSLLVGEGLLDKLHTGFLPQDDKRSYAIAKAKANNTLPVIQEYSHFGISLALFAAQMGLPYLPTKSQIGSDMLKHNENLTTAECPFSGEKLGAVRAVVPDVGILHVQRADAEGNAQKWGTLGLDKEGINGSRTVIVTAEKIVDSDIIRRDPNRTIIPAFRVSAVVEQPWGAHPMHLAGCYNGDMFGHMMDLASQEGYERYTTKLVYGSSDWDEFLKLKREVKGDDYFNNLHIKSPLKSEPVVTGY
ncbi:CoA transferase subunit A [Chloroflexota bacterium]